MKVCFVGAGSIGKRHINNLQYILNNKSEESEIHLLRSSHNLVEGIDVEKEFYSADELDDYYDSIFITNPTFKHLSTLNSLIDKSNCFFVEKPVFDSVDVDYSFIQKGKKIYVACPLRHMDVLRKVKQFINLEEVFHVRTICSTYLPDWRPGIDYRTCYSAHEKEGGGVRIDLIHEWDYLTALFGFSSEVFSFSGKNSRLEIDSEDIVSYIAKYDNKIIELHLDYFGRLPRRQMELYTEDHVYTVDLIGNAIYSDKEIIYASDEVANDKYLSEMEYYLDYCKGLKDNINDIDNAINVMKLAYK